MGLSNCSAPETPHAAAFKSLMRLGESAVPTLENAPQSSWTLKALALIEGRKALPRIRAVIADPHYADLRPDLDRIVAVLLDFTSSVTSRHGAPVINIEDRPPQVCGPGQPEPRDALDALIFAWITDDPDEFKRSLGTHARASIESLDLSWPDLRARFGPTVIRDVPSVSYRFEGNDSWATPRPLLDPSKAITDLPTTLVAHFNDRHDQDCGAAPLQFSEIGIGGDASLYKVDNADVIEILNVISTCASR